MLKPTDERARDPSKEPHPIGAFVTARLRDGYRDVEGQEQLFGRYLLLPEEAEQIAQQIARVTNSDEKTWAARTLYALSLVVHQEGYPSSAKAIEALALGLGQAYRDYRAKAAHHEGEMHRKAASAVTGGGARRHVPVAADPAGLTPLQMRSQKK